MPEQEQPSFHGMALFGERKTYFSHLAMFMPAHRYQAYFEVELTMPDDDPTATYLHDRQANPPGSAARPDHGSAMYGFEPIIDDTDGDPLTDLFVLDDLVARNGNSKPLRTAFKGTIWRGHFETFHPHEKGGRPILKNVNATVVRTVLFSELDHTSTRPDRPGYFLFGEPDDLYLTHVINRPPDYDQILAVQAAEHPFSDEDLRRGVHLTRPGGTDTVESRLTAQEVVQLNAENPEGTVRITVVAQQYFETDDLAKGSAHHH